MSATRQEIADEFARHVARFGYAKTTLDDVARGLRISKKTIYVHFEGKRAIYEHVVEQAAALERARLRDAVAGLPNASERVAAVIRSVVGSAREHIQRTDSTEWLQQYEVAADAFRKAHGDLLRELYVEGQAEGAFGPGDPALIERMLGVMAVEYVLMVRDDPAYDRDDELVRRMMRFIG